MKRNLIYIMGSMMVGALLFLCGRKIIIVGEHNYVSKTLAYSIAGASKEYYGQNNRWPQNINEILEFAERQEGYKDAYGNFFIYMPYRDDLKYGAIVSYGRDNKLGGSFWNRDIEIRFPLDQWNAWNEEHKPWAIAIR